MTSEDEMECRLLDDDTPVTNETTEEGTMPKVLSSLGKPLKPYQLPCSTWKNP